MFPRITIRKGIPPLRIVYRAVAMIALILAASALLAGPDLDRVLDYMFMDQTTPYKNPPQQFSNQREILLTKDMTIGETFVTGTETDIVARVRVYLAPTDWQKGEGVELAIWDSPAKKTKVGSYTIAYEGRFSHYNKADWNINAQVKRNSSYYFEITYAGGGDGKVARVGVMNGSDGYKSGQGYLNGKETDFDICFETHARKAPDRIGNLKRMFARIDLDLPGLAEVKQAVQKEDFETAIAKLVAYFEGRRKPYDIISADDVPKRNPDFDTKEADSLMNAGFNDVDMEGYGARKIMKTAYLNTGDDKYAKRLNDWLIDWYVNRPAPSLSKIGGSGWDPNWASLSTGLRLGHYFVAYSGIHASPGFSNDGRLVYIVGLADHCNTLVQCGGDAGGNWSFTQNSSMLTFAMNFPEFKDTAIWQKTAIERLTATMKLDILPDGVETESAPSYQRMAYNPVASGVYDDLIVSRGLKTPFATRLKTILEKQAEYFMYLAMPNGVAPCLGDWGHEDQRRPILEDAKRFGRSDMLYVGSAGKSGRKPIELSKMYPYAGMVTMRSDWGDTGRAYDDGRYLILHGVHWGAHGHNDLNSINLYAYGRELLTDPGAYLYGSPEHDLLGRAKSHNLMTVDNEDQNRRARTAFKNWSTTPVADYLSSWVETPGVADYTREVFYVRSNGVPGARDYWVVRDAVDGTGTHALDQRWRFMLDCPLTVDQTSLTCSTGYDKGGNLAIMQVDPLRLKVEQTTTDTYPSRYSEISLAKMPTVVYSANAALPAAIDTVLFPFEGKAGPGKINVIEKSADGLASAFEIVQGKVTDLFVMQRSSAEKLLTAQKVSFDGERLYVRKVGGRVRSVLLVNGSKVSIDGKQILDLATSVAWIAVSFTADGTKAYEAPKSHWMGMQGRR